MGSLSFADCIDLGASIILSSLVQAKDRKRNGASSTSESFTVSHDSRLPSLLGLDPCLDLVLGCAFVQIQNKSTAMNHSWTLVCLVLGFLALLGLWLDSPSHSPPNTDRELLVKFRQPTWALRRRQVESVQQLPVNNTDIETAVSNPAPPTNPSWKYSQYATIAPDPYRPAKTAAEGEDSSSSSSNPWSKEWGSWSFWDGDEGIRPARRPYADYAYRDVPGDDFDDNAWTVDAVFVNHILDAVESKMGPSKL